MSPLATTTLYPGTLLLAGIILESDISRIEHALLPHFVQLDHPIRGHLESGGREFFARARHDHLLPASVVDCLDRLQLSFSWFRFSAHEGPQPSIKKLQIQDIPNDLMVDIEIEDAEPLAVPPHLHAIAQRWTDDDTAPPFIVARSRHELLELTQHSEHGPAARRYLEGRVRHEV
jgi:hypothetical protein